MMGSRERGMREGIPMEPTNDPPASSAGYRPALWEALSTAWDGYDKSSTALDDLPEFDCDNRDQWIEHLESLDASMADLQAALASMRTELEAELERRKFRPEEIKE